MITRLEGPARVVAVGFWYFTAVFTWLVDIPFAYANFIQPRLLPDFIRVAEMHAWLTVVLLPVAWLSLLRPLAHPRSRRLAQGLLGAWALLALILPFTPSLAVIQPDGWGLMACFSALLFPLGCAIADMLSARPLPDLPAADRTERDFMAVLLATTFVVAFYASQAAASSPWSPDGFAASVLTHLVAAAAAFLVLTAMRAFASLRERPVHAEFWLATTLLFACLAAIVGSVILPTISVTSGARWFAGQAFAFTLTMGLVARGRLKGAPHGDGVLAALSGLVPAKLATRAPWVWALWLPAVAGAGLGIAAIGRIVDWNFLVSTLGVIVVWLLALVSALALLADRTGRAASSLLPARAALAGCPVALVAYLLVVPPPSHAGSSTPVDAWTVADPSFRTLREALRPPAPADTDFYPFLQRHTNLGPEVPVPAFDVRHAPLAGVPAATRPHVFLFVIDSLRRDYVSAYNPANTFTPALKAFAAENIVFDRAITRYGATGLSVPSIWVGGMVPHKQYPTPFGPFNALYALLMDQHYTPWLSWDNVVDVIVPREGTGPRLSANRAVKDFRFCEMVGDIRSRLDQLTPGGPPVFTWGLAQDVHISAITREGGGVVDDDPYPGFHPPYASRVRRVDACFGAFVDDLKARGLYDHSIIIFTADHGDSLGEEGRWGHAYTLFPEILQIPLIIHLPRAMRERFETDTTGVAFTADLTPTLYALLGYETTPPSPAFGQPLFWPRGQARPPRASSGALIASSYGSVYGWLDDNGRQLYVSDGVSLRDYRYELDGTPTGRALPVTPEDRRVGQKSIRAAIGEVASFYRYSVAMTK
ncbi:MAG: sulfatase-like hydrolase/transferase [Acidobacteria bacterium]|nr:sulfatase-like hydrolase/transferase [Acidobacteriota bacterium]